MAKDNKSKLTADYEGPIVDQGEEVDPRDVPTSEVPDGSVVEVEQWVSEDKPRAAAALKVEKAKGEDARSTLVHALERVLAED